MDPQWLKWARGLQAHAQNGLYYATNPFDRERYAGIRRIALDMLAAASDLKPGELEDLFAQQAGHATPKVDVRGAAFRDDRILLVRERADGLWTLPGGWADVNESPAESVERELWEESGYRGMATKLLAVWDRSRHGHPPHAFYIYKLVFRCELTGGAPQESVETNGVDFFAPDALPPLSVGRVTAKQIERLFEHMRRPELPTDFD